MIIKYYDIIYMQKIVTARAFMFKVAICDDEATSVQLNKALTEKILKENMVDYEIDCFSDMQEMIDSLSKVNNVHQYNVLLCDILTTDINGIEAAKRLRELGEQIDIVFISSTAEYALDGYSVQALRYIQKPVDIEKLSEALMISYRKSQDRTGLSVISNGAPCTIKFDDIIYIESQAREIDIHFDGGMITTHVKISDVEKMLPDSLFFRCHRSYIVNLARIKRLERYDITMNNDEFIPVSQQLYSETKTRYFKYNQN